MAMESRMTKTLSQIAETRQRLVSGKASQRELRSAVNKSLKLAIDSTNRMIQLAVEVLTEPFGIIVVYLKILTFLGFDTTPLYVKFCALPTGANSFSV